MKVDLQSVLSHVRDLRGVPHTGHYSTTPIFYRLGCIKSGTYSFLDVLIKFPVEHFSSLFECKAGPTWELDAYFKIEERSKVLRKQSHECRIWSIN